jgi:hypothetical protein
MVVLNSLVLMAVLISPWKLEEESQHPAVKEFVARVQQYVDLRKKVEASLPRLSKREEDPAEIIEHEKQIAAGLRAARAKAVRGDIFIPGVQPILLKMIRDQLGPTARSMILGDGNPKNDPTRVELKVNGTYPSQAPLSTVPPSVLNRLPILPQGVEYRFVGRHLILYDANANLIIDLLMNAVR